RRLLRRIGGVPFDDPRPRATATRARSEDANRPRDRRRTARRAQSCDRVPAGCAVGASPYLRRVLWRALLDLPATRAAPRSISVRHRHLGGWGRVAYRIVLRVSRRERARYRTRARWHGHRRLGDRG